jgi:drug/metabolite transporter (DMT)-like permease
VSDNSGRNGLRHLPGRAVLYMFAAVAFQTVLDASVKWLTTDYTVPQIAFIRYLFSIAIAVLLAGRMGGLGTLKTGRPIAHALRALLNIVTMLTFYFALMLLPLADAIAITFAAPLFMTAFSVLFLRERVGVARWAAVVIGLVGVILILQPNGTGVTTGSLLALASAVFYALAFIFSRQLSATETSHTILFYYSVGVLAMMGLVGLTGETGIAPSWKWAPLRLEDLWIFMLVGLAGSFGQFFFNQAFRYGEVSMLAPIEYTALLWGVAYGLLLWDDVPSWAVIAGAAIVAGASLYVVRRETRLARRPAAAPDDLPGPDPS